MHIGQAEVAASVAVGQLLVIKAEQVEHRGVEVMDGDFVLDGGETEFVGRAVDLASLHAAARQPAGEAVVIVIAAVDLAGVGSRSGKLDGRSPSKFAAPQDERFIEQPAFFQIAEQRADRFVALACQAAVIDLDVVVVVPRLAFAVPKLDEANASFDEASGDQKLPRLNARSVSLLHVLRFLLDVEGVGRLHLHPVSQLERMDASFQRGFVRAGLGVTAVQFLQQIELPPLLAPSDLIVADVLDQLFDLRVLGVDVRPLEDTGQERRSPVLRPRDRQAVRTHRDKAGEVLVLGPQSIRDPRTEAWPHESPVAAVHQHERRLVVGDFRVHRPNHADVIDMLSRVLEEFAHLDATLAVLRELVRRPQRGPGLAFGRQVRRRQRLAVILRQRWLRIERVHMRRPAVQKDVNDMLRLPGVLRRMGDHRRRADRRGFNAPRRATRAREQTRQPKRPQPGPRTRQKLAPR